MALIQSQGDIGRLTAGPPGIPQDRLDALRAAYKAAMEDKELQAKAAKLQVPVEPLYGDDVLKPREAGARRRRRKTVALLKEAIGKAGSARGGQQGDDRRMGRPRQARAEAGRRQDVPGRSLRLAHRNHRRRAEEQS